MFCRALGVEEKQTEGRGAHYGFFFCVCQTWGPCLNKRQARSLTAAKTLFIHRRRAACVVVARLHAPVKLPYTQPASGRTDGGAISELNPHREALVDALI